MSFLDIGFNFRATAGFVTDQPFAVPVLGEAYPHTYTNQQGVSINAGWVTSPSGQLDRLNTNDPRITGINFIDASGPRTFRIDLDSGSGPGRGRYTVDFAMGDAALSNDPAANAKIQDNQTTIDDLTNGGAGFNLVGLTSQFVDATGTIVAATNPWTGKTKTLVFSTPTVNIVCASAPQSNFTKIAHVRLTPAPLGVIQGVRPMYKVPIRVATTTALAAGGLQPVAGAPPPLAGAAFQDVFTSSAQTLAAGANQTVSWPAVPAGQRGIVEAIALTSSDPTTVTFQTTKNGVGVSPYPTAHLGSLGTLLNPFVLPTGIAMLAGDVFAIVVTNTSGAPITFQVRSIGAFFS